jgi:hypothetical protein
VAAFSAHRGDQEDDCRQQQHDRRHGVPQRREADREHAVQPGRTRIGGSQNDQGSDRGTFLDLP